jgi:hypothetical protein
LGALVWATGKYVFDLSTPYLLGLLAATLGYIVGALLERAQQ